MSAPLYTQEQLDAAVAAERARCTDWAQYFRGQGNPDYREMLSAIRGGGHPEPDEDEE